MSPVRAALKRPVTVAMLCIAAMLFGLVALRVVPLQLLPEGFESAGMTLIFPYPNADPLSVERDVVRPVEEALGTVTALDEINVTASANRARIRLSFSGRTDMAMAALEVRDRLERIRSELPPEAQRFFLWRHSASSFPDMAFGVLVPESAGLEGFQIVARRLIPKLQRVDGIASVDTWGGLVDQQAYVELDEHRVRSHRVQLYDLIQRLSAENFTLPAGAVEDGGRRMLVRSAAPFNGLEDLERYPVDRNLTIGDLGEGVLRTAYRDRVSRMDGQAIVWLVINKESGRNTVEVCARMREAVEDLATDPALEGFQVLPIWDAGESIESALGQLTQSILWGGLLAVLCLFLFFRDLKATLVVAAAIPFSALVAMSVLVLFGYTLNVLSLAGLTLAVGMLVDNAIVVVENVVRRREAGEPMATAAAGGAGEVALAITLATFTTIAVFVPLVFVSEEPQVRLMISNLAGPISFGLLASLATAILVVPLLAVRLRTRATEPKGLGILTRLRRVSVGAADMALSHRVETLVLLIALLGAGSWFLSERVERVNDGPGGSDQIRVGVTLDASTTLYETHQIFEQYEQFLIPRKAEYGAKHVQVRFSRGDGSLQLRLLPSKERASVEEIRKKLRDELPRFAGAKLSFRGGFGEGGESMGGEGARVTVALSGPDSEVLFEVADELGKRLEELKVFEEVDAGTGEGAREVRVALDREAVQRAGTTPQMVLGTLSYQLRGSRLPDLRLGEDDIPLIVSFKDPEDGEGLKWLRQMPVGRGGAALPLESIAKVTTAEGPRDIRRVDRRTQVEVKASVPRAQIQRAEHIVREVLATFPLPEGVTAELGGSFREFEMQVQEIMKVLGLGVAFMFLIMGVLFESFLLPIAVLPSIPFAFFGGYLALYLTDTPQDVVATLGWVVLAGIVVNNAIVLVDAINRGRADGLPQADAVRQAVHDRFRPVILTATTTIVGLLPMAWTPASEGVLSYHSLARAVIGGLAVSTIGTLVAVPLLYVMLDDMRGFFGRVATRYWRTGA